MTPQECLLVFGNEISVPFKRTLTLINKKSKNTALYETLADWWDLLEESISEDSDLKVLAELVSDQKNNAYQEATDLIDRLTESTDFYRKILLDNGSGKTFSRATTLEFVIAAGHQVYSYDTGRSGKAEAFCTNIQKLDPTRVFSSAALMNLREGWAMGRASVVNDMIEFAK
jgi:hypothetical protein